MEEREDSNISGTKEGGIAARDTNYKRHGRDFYRRLGALGGKARGEKGFASFVVGKDGLTGRERSRIAGRKGGQISRSGKRVNTLARENREKMAA